MPLLKCGLFKIADPLKATLSFSSLADMMGLVEKVRAEVYSLAQDLRERDIDRLPLSRSVDVHSQGVSRVQVCRQHVDQVVYSDVGDVASKNTPSTCRLFPAELLIDKPTALPATGQDRTWFMDSMGSSKCI